MGRAVAALLLEAVSGHAVEAAIKAVEPAARKDDNVKLTLQLELEQARYEASLAARRYEVVDPAKRLVARELETRWNNALEAARQTIIVDETAQRLGICVGSVHQLIRRGVLSASQLMPSAPWQVPLAALDSEAVQIGVREIIDRRRRNIVDLQDEMTLSLPGF